MLIKNQLFWNQRMNPGPRDSLDAWSWFPKDPLKPRLPFILQHDRWGSLFGAAGKLVGGGVASASFGLTILGNATQACTAQLKDAGFTLEQLKEAGFNTPKELAKTGYSAADLKKSGFTLAELREAGLISR